jgi:hypothetical protein
MGIVTANPKVLNLVNNVKNKNISIEKIKDLLSYKELSDIYSKPNKGQLDKLFLKTLDNISEGRDIYCTISSFTLFLEWAVINYPQFDEEIFYEGDIENIFEAYSAEKSKSITLRSLERTLKLFSMFYGKELKKTEVKEISIFQYNLIDGNIEEVFNQGKKIKKIVEEKKREKENSISTVNIFNKILEFLDILESLSTDDYKREEKNSFIILSPSDKRKQEYKEEFKKMLGL